MIYWDLDGVLRDLNTACFGHQAPSWDYKVKGKGICEIIYDNPELLILAPAFPYLKLFTGHILSVAQDKSWWSGCTVAWCDKNINRSHSVTFFTSPEKKLNYLKPGDVLIEDNPIVAGHPGVWLIDRPYNRMVTPTSGIRIKSVKQLKVLLEDR